ncbi:MAG: helix-turn-helix transcriptional regulator [Clostridia bacterium]|nr:helix-turn-helix transcriptional regulator [Clostridia bacterium]
MEVIFINPNTLSPYVRLAMMSVLRHGFHIGKRVIYDYELIYVSGGKARITIDGVPYICKKNDTILLRPGIPHEFECVDGCDFNQPHIHFDMIYNPNSEITPISYKNKPVMTDNELLLIQPDIMSPCIPYVFTPYDADAFEKLFFDIIALYQKHAFGFEIMMKAKLLELLALILGQFETVPYRTEAALHDPIATVKSYIDNNYLQIITLEDLQSQFFINKYTLIRNFKRFYNQSPMLYYRERRFSHAKALLSTTTRAVASIAEELNFPDISSFSRFFHSFAGISPREYREAMRASAAGENK